MADVVLVNPGKNKVAVIKAIQRITKVSLVNAKQLVEKVPTIIVSGVSFMEAQEYRNALEVAGAQVTVKE